MMVNFLISAAAVAFSAQHDAPQATILLAHQFDKFSPLKAIEFGDRTLTDKWAKDNHFHLKRTQDGKWQVLMSETLVPIKSAKLTAEFFQLIAKLESTSFSADSPQGSMAISMLIQRIPNLALPKNSNRKFIQLGLAFEITDTSGKMHTQRQSSFDESNPPESVEGGNGDLRDVSYQEPKLGFSAIFGGEGKILFWNQPNHSQPEALLALSEVFDHFAKELRAAYKECQDAMIACQSALMSKLDPSLTGKIPGPTRWSEMPDSIKKKIQVLAERYPEQLGFASSEDAKVWLASNPSLRIDSDLMLAFNVSKSGGFSGHRYRLLIPKD